MKNEELTLLNVEESLLRCRLIIDQLKSSVVAGLPVKSVQARHTLLLLYIAEIERLLGTHSKAKFDACMKNLD